MSAAFPSCFMIWGETFLGVDNFGPRSDVRSAEGKTCGEKNEKYQDQTDPRHGLLVDLCPQHIRKGLHSLVMF